MLNRAGVSKHLLIPVLAAIGLLLAAACGGQTEEAQEQARSCTVGGSADEGVFAQYFTAMDFGSGTAGDSEGGQQFSASKAVVVVATATQPVTVRFCGQERGRPSDVVFDQTLTLPVGESQVDLGVVGEEGARVIRVTVGETLVKNLTFEVR